MFSEKRIQRRGNRKSKILTGEKGLVLYPWCMMSNYLHLIISAKENNVSDIPGDFKKLTSKQLMQSIIEHLESRKEWIEIFKKAGVLNSEHMYHQFW